MTAHLSVLSIALVALVIIVGGLFNRIARLEQTSKVVCDRLSKRIDKLDPDSRTEFINEMSKMLDVSVAKHVYHAVKEQFKEVT